MLADGGWDFTRCLKGQHPCSQSGQHPGRHVGAAHNNSDRRGRHFLSVTTFVYKYQVTWSPEPWPESIRKRLFWCARWSFGVCVCVCVWEFPHLGWTVTNVARRVCNVYRANIQPVKWHILIRNTSLWSDTCCWSYQTLASSWFLQL